MASLPQIKAVEVVTELSVLRQLFEEYASLSGVEVCVQNFAAELAGLPGVYAAPRGRLLVAFVDGQPAGCVALRPWDEQRAEMKRFYVRPSHQRLGVGRKLAERVIVEARAIGYSSILLDTLPTMQAAIGLYTSLGFTRCPPYSDSIAADDVCMELKLMGDTHPRI